VIVAKPVFELRSKTEIHEAASDAELSDFDLGLSKSLRIASFRRKA
jgi:hypothetical protein